MHRAALIEILFSRFVPLRVISINLFFCFGGTPTEVITVFCIYWAPLRLTKLASWPISVCFLAQLRRKCIGLKVTWLLGWLTGLEPVSVCLVVFRSAYKYKLCGRLSALRSTANHKSWRRILVWILVAQPLDGQFFWPPNYRTTNFAW